MFGSRGTGITRQELAKAAQTKLLDLSGRALTAVPPEVCQISGLRSLNLARNQLTSLPPGIRRLTDLTSLNLRENRLASFPRELGLLSRLHSLNLASNQLTTVSGDIGSLSALQELSLSGNRLSTVPAEIGKLSALQTLDLSANILATLPREFGLLRALVSLKISGNRLSSLPAQIGLLTSLQQLNASGNHLAELPAEIGRLAALQNLVLEGNELTELPVQIGQLAALRNLNLDRNLLTALPPQIGQMAGLQNLYLDDNVLADLPSQIGQLTRLQNLYLDRNSLIDLPQSLAVLLRAGLIVHLTGNPLPDLMFEVASRGHEALATYLDSLGDAIALFEAKTMVVGEGAVGKTSLLAALRGEAFVAGRPTTHGIEVHTIFLPHPSIAGQDMTVRMWDFGGQEVYRITHQFFFSPRALYLLAWNPRKGALQSDVEGWLRRIRLRVQSDATVIIVATYGRERRPELDYASLNRAFPGTLAGNLIIDSEPPALGIGDLKRAIADRAARLPQMGQLVSARWIKVRDSIEKLADSQPQIPFGDLRTICHDSGIKSEREIRVLADLMHDLGHIIYYGSELGLSDVVVLNPEWLTKAISRVLEDEPTRTAGGVLDHARLAEIWDLYSEESGWRREHYPYFLRLMEKFDISYRLRDDDSSSLVAQLVPYERPIDLPWDFDEPVKPGFRSLRLICRLSEEAPGLISWLTVRHHPASTGKHWRNGVFLRHPHHIYESAALLEMKSADQLRLEVRSPSPNLFFSVLRDSIEWLIRQRWPGLDFEILVPCPGRTPNDKACPEVFPALGLDRTRLDGQTTHRCLTCGNVHDISALLTGFPQPDPAWGPALDRLDQRLTKVDQGIERMEAVVADSAHLIRILLKTVAIEVRDCPRLFTITPARRRILPAIRLTGTSYTLTLWCEHPDHWHPVAAAKYKLNRPQDWLVALVPYASITLKALRLIVPIVTLGVPIGIPGDDPRLRYLEQMQNLLDSLPEAMAMDEEFDEADLHALQDPRLTQAVGQSARALRQILRKCDPAGRFGGLSRVTSLDGEERWVCVDHYRYYDPGLPQLPH